MQAFFKNGRICPFFSYYEIQTFQPDAKEKLFPRANAAVKYEHKLRWFSNGSFGGIKRFQDSSFRVADRVPRREREEGERERSLDPRVPSASSSSLVYRANEPKYSYES